MGYLTDNTTPGKNHTICQDLYQFRIFVKPKFASNIELSLIIKDVIPDVEEWQFSGRRRNPVIPSRGRARPIRSSTYPSTWAQNSRRMRPFTEEVVFAFHTEVQRIQAGARLTSKGFKFRFVDEPTSSVAGAEVFIIV